MTGSFLHISLQVVDGFVFMSFGMKELFGINKLFLNSSFMFKRVIYCQSIFGNTFLPFCSILLLEKRKENDMWYNKKSNRDAAADTAESG